MYNDFYGFKKKPFSLNPDPDFLFLGKTHKSILSQLEYGLLNELGILVVTGEIGTGKSTHIHYLLGHLEQNYTVALITNTYFSDLAEMLVNILWAFGIERDKTDEVDMLVVRLNEFLTSNYHSQQKVLLIIDEAQNLSVELLEYLRLLSNFTIDDHQVLQLILVGQDEFKDTIERPGLEQLRQRISIFEELSPLDRKETHQYILHRLEVAGGVECRKIMTQSACSAIYNYSRGIPRLINLIAELVLYKSFNEEIIKIDSDRVEEVIKERKGGVLQFNEFINVFDPPDSQEDDYLQQLHADESLATFNDNENESIYTSNQSNNLAADKEIDSVEKDKPLIAIKGETVDLSFDLAQTSSSEQKLWENMAFNASAKKDYEEEVVVDSELIDKIVASRSKTAGKGVFKTLIIIIFALVLFIYASDYYKFNKIKVWLAEIKELIILNKDKILNLNTIDSTQVDRTTNNNIENEVDQVVSKAAPNTQLDTKAVVQSDVPLSIKTKSEVQKAESNIFQSAKASDELKNDGPELVKVPGLELAVQQDEQQNENNTSDEEINVLLAIAKEQVTNLKFTIPATDCALDTYNKILKIEPEQKQALEGLKNIKGIYVFWAERELRRSNVDQAEEFYKKALLVAPFDKTLAASLARVKLIRGSLE